MAKIAAELQHALARRRELGAPGRPAARILAQGDGWTVADVLCTSGPQDRPFEERHTHYSVAVVVAGTFQYRSTLGRGMMTPGSLLLGNSGHVFECGHEHAEGDRCVAFWFAPEYFERVAADAGRTGTLGFDLARLPPVRPLARAVARVAAGLLDPDRTRWEELGLDLAGRAIGAAAGARLDSPRVPTSAEARVTRIVRAIDREPSAPLTLARLAGAARLTPYHFLRTFERISGVTPHQYVLRARLRAAALRLQSGGEKVVDVALACGFGDVSNFNRAFRAEFGASPRAFAR